MKIISLSSSIAGPACAIAYCIKHFYYNDCYISNFFDNLEVSLYSITQVLKNRNSEEIENKLNTNNFIFLNKDDKSSVCFNNFNKMISHHDLSKNYTSYDYNIFIEKYKRRFNRLIETIINEDIIFFIRYGNEQYENIIDFMNEINRINNNLKVYFINVNFDEHNIIKNYDIKNYVYINFNAYLDNTIEYHDNLYHKTIQFNWLKVFDIINNL